MATSSSTIPDPLPSSTDQEQKVDFDSSYKKGAVYVFPPIKKSSVNVFKVTKPKEKAPQDPLMPPLEQEYVMEADQGKMKSGQDKLKGDKAEDEVVAMLHQQLQNAAKPGDTPVFIFTSLQLRGCEKDVIIYHEEHGVIIIEVKAIEDVGTAAAPKGRSTLVKAAEQLIEARDAVTSKLQKLLECTPTLLVAFPNLHGTDPQDVRQRVKFFQDNPDVGIVCGREKIDYDRWLQQVAARPKSLVWKAQPDSHQAFVKAVSRHLSVEPFSPSQIASDLAQVHRSWLLTPDQASVLHCKHRLLHLRGPPGSGKTTLLLHRARKWLKKGKNVIVCVGNPAYSALLQHLGRAAIVGDESSSSNRITMCRQFDDFKKTLMKLGDQVHSKYICVLVDEVEGNFTREVLAAFQNHQISRLWTASVSDISSTEFSKLKGEKILLEHSIRCPPNVVEAAKKLQEITTSTAPPMIGFPYLPAYVTTASVKAVFHPSHQSYRRLDRLQSTFDCENCNQWLKSSLSPLVEGLSLKHEWWRNWIILYTGTFDLKPMLAEWLRSQGIPAVLETETDLNPSNLPVSSIQRSGVKDEKALYRERVVSGTDMHGDPAVHFVDYEEFRGLEKPCVLVLLWDMRDDHPDEQRESERIYRKSEHSDKLYEAVTRCQAELSVCLLSPSPAVSCLPVPCEEIEEWRRKEPRVLEEERRRLEEERRARQWRCVAL